MTGSIDSVVIVGGGTAGWLSAAYLAARHPRLSITLVESPDVPTIGVGEGTWPTMRATLEVIGISESEFLRECDASFKQGSRFDGWQAATGSSYLHPFTPPPPGDMAELLAGWRGSSSGASFAYAMTPQAAACRENLAPRQRAMPDYAAALNYGYHLDAAKFAALLTRHATARLGVRHVRGHVIEVRGDGGDGIASIVLRDGTEMPGDLFLDCSGSAGLLIDKHLATGWIDRSDVSFNDRALAVQVPVKPDSAIASQTVGTAHGAGWLWDIALPTRRGIGCVYSSRFLGDDEAEETLRAYVAAQGLDTASLQPRRLAFRTGYRERFWRGNCLAIGQSTGFIEPLEASAIVMVELSLRALADQFPADREVMSILARRFDGLFRYRWERIVEFLKLHYVLSDRQESYWQAHRDPETIPPRLAENLALWRHQPPSQADFPQVDEVFSAASQQYVLYGMGFAVPSRLPEPGPTALARLAEVRERTRTVLAALPSNRSYLSAAATAAQNLRQPARA